MKPRKISLKDVATEAEVSVSLVSFVLNGRAEEMRVKKETADRVIQASKRLRYRPNFNARVLKSGHSFLLGLIVTDISNPFFASISRCMGEYAQQFDYSVLIMNTDESAEKFERSLHSLMQRGVDGIIAVPTLNSYGIVRMLRESGLPFVLIDRYYPELESDYVVLDNATASYQATKWLLSQGYKTTAMITYNIRMVHMEGRISGYQTAMKEFGLTPDVVELDQYHIEQSAAALLPGKAMECDSFLFSTNMIALASLPVIESVKHRMAEKAFGMVGFDYTPLYDFYTPKISYVKQPIDEIAKKSMDLILKKITKKDDGQVQHVVLDAPFIVNQ